MKLFVIAAGVVAATLTASRVFARDATPFDTQADAVYTAQI